MKDSLSRFAPFVFWAGVIVLVLGAVVILSSATAGSGRGPVPTEYMIVAGIALLIISALMRPDDIRRVLGIRGVRYGGNALIVTLGFIAILGIINYLATQPRFDFRQDLTANQQFTLSDQTIQILQNLKAPIKATAFYSPAGGSPQAAQDQLREYALRSNGKLTYEIVDPEAHPDLARAAGLTHDGGVVFQANGKNQEAISTSESDFTTAILKVTTDTPHTAAFIIGNRERDPADTANTGFSTVQQWLEKDNYTVVSLNMVITTTIPATTTVVILAAPKDALPDAAVKALSDYLDQGGRLLVMSDPNQPAPLAAALAKWGIAFENDEAFDPVQYVQSPLLPAVQQYEFSTITQKMSGLVTVFPLARSIKKIDPAPAGSTVQSIVHTTAQAWGETTLDTSVPPQYDPAKDIKGPLDLMVSIESTSPVTGPVPTAGRKTRIVAFGNSEFVSNNILQAQQLQGIANIDLFMNSVNWLAEDESLISIRPTPPDTRTVVMTDSQKSTVFVLAVLGLPALVFVTGFSVWWRRR
jgi:ABC-type uncharacterized transport system involved in gliding motility auxiliary subunit